MQSNNKYITASEGRTTTATPVTDEKKTTNSTDHGVNFFMVERLQGMSSKKWFILALKFTLE